MTMMRALTIASILLAGTCQHVLAQQPSIAEVAPKLETLALTEADNDADADDPAIWINAADPARSLIVTAVKNGGIRVYDLDGQLMQSILPAEDGRINNVDVVYGFELGGEPVDLVVAADRGLDVIRTFRIDAAIAEPLTEVTDPAAARAFPTRYLASGSTEDNPVDDQNTVYGLAAWRNSADGKTWVVGTQRHQPTVGIFTLAETTDGHVSATLDHDFNVPSEHDGQDLFAENEDDPLLDFSPQFEGTVIDRETGVIYAGQEDVGIWSVALSGGEPELLYATRGSSESSFHNTDSVISRDVEGLTIYYGGDVRYLLASSQGGAHGDAPAPDAPYDDSFAVFDITSGFELLGQFRVSAAGDMDAVQESDGADVTSIALPGFENGLFITQDGYAGDLNGLDGETASTDFKFVDWKAIAETFEPPLAVAPQPVAARQ